MMYNGNVAAGQKAVPISELTFDTLLDETIERLLDRQVKYSIQRIHELEKRLENLERELNEFMRSR